MKRIAKVIVGSNGAVDIDYVGYVGQQECAPEEERVRARLASFGLVLKADSRKEKSVAEGELERDMLNPSVHQTVTKTID